MTAELGAGEVQRALFHLVCHEVQGVRACGREVLLEAGAVDETHVGGENVIRGFAVEDSDKKRDHALGDERIRVGGVVDGAAVAGGIDPDLRLTALDQVLGGFGRVRHGSEFFPETDDVFIAFGPILKKGEFFDEEFLFCCNAHAWRSGARETGSRKSGSGRGGESLQRQGGQHDKNGQDEADDRE